jgi:hypothetical protein
MKYLVPLCASLVLATASAPARADFQAYHVNGGSPPPNFSGKLDDPSWAKAPMFDTFYQRNPQDKVPARVRTEVRIMYDERYVYFGIKAFEPNPDAVRAPFSRRDKTLGDQDLMILFLDPTGSRKAAQFIRVNPRGSVSDGAFSDTSGEDFSPDFDFDTATGTFDGGWTAEVRIPFSSLAYTDPKTTPWNLLVMRSYLRDERYRIANAAMPRDSSCFLCFAEPVQGLQAPEPKMNWSATPQLRLQSSRQQPGKRENEVAASLDLKVRPSGGVAVDLTVNPDFSQVDLDAPQLSGNSAFGLFFPEKRPFFLEGADMLSTPQRAIYTRAINDPSWGVRVTRRNAGSDLTMLTTRDAGGGLVLLPGSYGTNYAAQDFSSRATIARGTYRAGDSAYGLVATDRSLSDDRGHNRVFGPDFTWDKGDAGRVTAQLLGSDTTALPDAQGRLVKGQSKKGHAARANYEAQSATWGIWSDVQQVSQDFRADNGFFEQAGFRSGFVEIRRKFGNTGPMNVFNLYAYGSRKIDMDGDVIDNSQAFGLWMQGPYDSAINLKMKPANEVRVRKGGKLLQRDRFNATLEISPNRFTPRLIADLEVGDMVDTLAERTGKGATAYLYGKLRPTDRIEVEPSVNLLVIDGQLGGRAYTESAVALNGIVHFSARDTLRLIWQHTETKRDRAQYTMPVESKAEQTTTSLVYTHTRGLGTALYVGLTLSDSARQAARYGLKQNEFFVKGSWQI